MALISELVIFVIAIFPALILTLIQSRYLSGLYLWFFLAVSTLLIWWLIQPTIHFQDQYKKHDSKALRKIVDELSQKAKAQRIHEIVLTDEMNAAAYQSKGFFGVLFVKRTLIVGIPLLRLLTVQQLQAVISHELGHFSKNHGRFGHWLYSVRIKWARYLSPYFYESTYADAILKPYAKFWLPLFLVKSAEWSRQCEYEADGIAAEITEPVALISGLYRLTNANEFEANSLISSKRQRCLAVADAPQDYWDWVVEQSMLMRENLYVNYQSYQQRRKSKLYDTHPSPAERATALGIADFSQITSTDNLNHSISAGKSLFEDAWPTLIGECNRRWCEKNASYWLTWHLQLKQIQTTTASNSDLFTKAWQQERLSPQLKINADLTQFAVNQPDHALAQFACGEAFYARDDERCLDYFKSALKIDAAYALQASQYMLAYQNKFGSETEISYAQGRVDHYLKKARFDYSELWQDLLQGSLAPAIGPALNILKDVVGADPLIDACWIVRLQDRYTSLKHASIDVLILRMTTKEALDRGLTDDEIASRYAHHLQTVSEPNRLCECMIRYSTESIHPELLKNLQSLGDIACIKAPTVAININIAKYDQQ